MRSFSRILVMLLSISLCGVAHAQWVSSGGSTTTTDKVGVGITTGLGNPLTVSGANSGPAPDFSSPSPSQLRIHTTTTSGEGSITFTQPDGGTNGWTLFGVDNKCALNPCMWMALSGAKRFVVDNGGRVGIGVVPDAAGITTVAARLHVASGSAFITGDSGTLTGAGAGIALKYTTAGNAQVFGYDYTNSVPKDLILEQPGGFVGIGTTPLGVLHVKNGGTSVSPTNSDPIRDAAIEGPNRPFVTETAQLSIIANDAVAADNGGSIAFGSKYNGDSWSYNAGIKAGRADANTLHLGGYLAFATRPITGSGTPTERMRIDSEGNVAIGTPSASALLTVGPSGGSGTKLVVNGDAVVTGAITGARVINAVYQDVAEWVPAAESLQPGTVVVLDSDHPNVVTMSKNAYDTAVAGVVSPNPGIVLGVPAATKAQVATTGRVKVHVDATVASIKIGDLLVTGNKPGTAMKSEPIDVGGGIKIHRPGTVVGKALEPLQNGEGDILVLLSLQ